MPLQQSSVRNFPPRVLLIEDNLLVLQMLEEWVLGLGYAVSGRACTVAAARQELAKREFDAVLLDIKLSDGGCTEIADILLELGTPFAFVTGYNRAPEPRHERVPLLCKPCTLRQFSALLEKLVGPMPSSADYTAKAG